MESDPETFKSHSAKQDALISSDEETTVAASGTQWGKSQGGAIWMKRQCHTFTDSRDNFVIGAPTYKILQQSTIPYFLHVMRGCGEYLRADAIFRISGGGTVYFRTETDPDSIVGIPRTRAGWLDEAGKLRLYFWQNYQARAAAMGALTLLTTSPYSRNWLYKEIVKPHEQGKPRPRTKLIRAASWENPYHMLSDPIRRAQMRASMDARRFDMLFGGEFGQMAGLVYDCFDDAENQVDPFQLPTGTKYYAGVDWGFNPDPFVIKVRAITPDGRHYSVSEFYKTGLTLPDMVEVARQKKETYGIKAFYCDPSQPGSIEEFNRRGLVTLPADNDINRGVGLHYELIKLRKFKLFKGLNPNTLDEYETYHYPEPEDLEPDQDAKPEKPVKQNDHCADADRYVTISTYRTANKHTPKVPGQFKATDRIEYLKRRRDHRNASEEWSDSNGEDVR
jgi:phage terminase large subunit